MLFRSRTLHKVAWQFPSIGPGGFDPNARELPSYFVERPPAELDSPEERGVMSKPAASIVMKIMYAARMGRFDLLRPVQGLARCISKWSFVNDLELHRLVCYINSSKTKRMCGWVGDSIKDIHAVQFSDSDYAGCVETKRSTTGGMSVLKGEHTSFPITAVSKRQSVTSTSTTEAELTAAQFNMQRSGMAIISIWGDIVRTHGFEAPPLSLLLDNTAMLEIIRTGRNLTMRHLKATHGICITWLHETCDMPNVKATYISTNLMCADIFTKPFTNKAKWEDLCSQISLCKSAPDAGTWPQLEDLLFLHGRLMPALRAPRQRGKFIGYDPAPLPLDCPQCRSTLGWQEIPGGRLCIVREPVQNRRCDEPGFPIRTTWIRDGHGWRKVEHQVRWEMLSSPTGPLQQIGRAHV